MILDSELGHILSISTSHLNQQAKRVQLHHSPHAERMSWEAFSEWLGGSDAHGGRRYPPWKYTFEGAMRIASSLNKVPTREQIKAILHHFDVKDAPFILTPRKSIETPTVERLLTVLDGVVGCYPQYRLEIGSSVYWIDLYVPTLNLAIEVDEHWHRFQTEDDHRRQSQIMNKLNCEFLRIKPEDDVDEVINQVLIRFRSSFGTSGGSKLHTTRISRRSLKS